VFQRTGTGEGKKKKTGLVAAKQVHKVSFVLYMLYLKCSSNLTVQTDCTLQSVSLEVFHYAFRLLSSNHYVYLIVIGYVYQQMLIQYVKYCKLLVHLPTRVAVRSKAGLCCCSLAGIISNPARVMDVCILRMLCVVR